MTTASALDRLLQHDVARRDVLRLGGLAGCAVTLPGLLQQRAAADEQPVSSFGRARQVIMLFLHGGHPQQETFDPKPDGPEAVRGEFGAISTSVPGIHFSDVLPRTARLMHRLAIVRSMSHGNPNHVQACLPAQTGHVHPESLRGRGDFPPSANDFPPVGAVVDALSGRQQTLPNWVRVGPLMRRSNGTVLHGQVPGLLGAAHSSFVIDQPLLADDVEIRAVQRADELSTLRLQARADLLRQFDHHSRHADRIAAAGNLDVFYQKAFDLLSSSETRQAFRLADERPEVRQRYGKTEFGQRCLLARRLAEAGVPLVNVSYCHTPSGSWDTHSRNFSKMRDSLGPTFDQAFSALIEDLEQRGRLDDTLVVVNAEFGRTPVINRNAGRDHWPHVYSLVLAGAGADAGVVYGASDSRAAYPAERPHDPRDFIATLYHLLGIPSDATFLDAQQRPHRVVIGQPIAGLLA